MSRIGWLGTAVFVAAMSGAVVTSAASPPDSTIEARMRALEKRVSDLEQKNADLERRAAQAPASAPAPAPVVAAPAAAPVAAPQAAPRWQDRHNWASLRVGMTWSQVKALLGVPGTVKAGVFGDVMYFPDDSGGSVEFDRDGRVAKWSEAPSR